MPAERAETPPSLRLIDVVSKITPETIQKRMIRRPGGGFPEARKIQPHLDVVLRRTSRLVSQIRSQNALPPNEELVLIDNLQQQLTKAIQLVINENVRPKNNYTTAFDTFHRENDNSISAVTQYRECPLLETVTSRDGYVHAWYLRRTEPVGKKTVYLKSRGDDARSVINANQPEQLVLRRKFPLQPDE